MIYLIDTNILLRVLHRTNTSSPIAETVVRKLLSNGHELHATTQNFIEFWVAIAFICEADIQRLYRSTGTEK